MVSNIGIGQEGRLVPQSPGALASRSRPIADGTLVEGKVLSVMEGAYMVKIQGREMLAQSNLSLFPGQHFRALWDGRGQIPMLRLSPEDAALFGRLPKGDQDIASMLLSKGLPVTDGFLLAVRREMKFMNGDPKAMNALIELMARGEGVSQDKVGILIWYMDLDPKAVAHQWRKIQRELEERKKKGENPINSIKSMKDQDDDTGRFLKAQGILSKPEQEAFKGASLAGAWWPAPDEESLPASVRFSSVPSNKDKGRFYMADFSLDGETLGTVEGLVESDGKSMAVTLNVQSDQSREILQRSLKDLQRDLESGSLSLQYLGVTQKPLKAPGFFKRLDVEA